VLTAIVDTNVLVRIITNDDADLARKARALLERYQNGQIALETAIFYETAFVLTYKKYYGMPRDVAANLLRGLLNTGLFVCDEALLLATLELYETTKFDFIDCLVAAQVRLGRVKTLLTLDQPLLKRLESLV
jgi:predicted nucleic-acid-binding protein